MMRPSSPSCSSAISNGTGPGQERQARRARNPSSISATPPSARRPRPGPGSAAASGTPAPAGHPCRSRRVGSPPRHRIRCHVAAGEQEPVQPRHARQPPPQRPGRHPARACPGDLQAAFPAGPLHGHERQHVGRPDPPRRLADHGEEDLRSSATASTVFGRHRPARNSRYSSSSRTPSRTTNSPAAFRDRVRQTTITGMQALHLRKRTFPRTALRDDCGPPCASERTEWCWCPACTRLTRSTTFTGSLHRRL
jgi:hypothetical protein